MRLKPEYAKLVLGSTYKDLKLLVAVIVACVCAC